MLSVGLLVGCSTEVAEAPVIDKTENVAPILENEPEEVNVSIKISVEGETIEELSHDYQVAYGIRLMELMKDHYRLVEEDGFIRCIEGNGQNEEEGLFWVYTVNGEMVGVSAVDYELQEGDVVDWQLVKFD